MYLDHADKLVHADSVIHGGGHGPRADTVHEGGHAVGPPELGVRGTEARDGQGFPARHLFPGPGQPRDHLVVDSAMTGRVARGLLDRVFHLDASCLVLEPPTVEHAIDVPQDDLLGQADGAT